TVLAVWREPLAEMTAALIEVDRGALAAIDAPAPRLIPVALRAAECRLSVAAVCTARPLAEGRPPLGIACIQQEVSHVYPLTDDPEHALADFFERAADHAHSLADQLAHQEASVQRFLELSGEERRLGRRRLDVGEVAAQLAQFVAQPRRVLEAQLLGGLEH